MEGKKDINTVPLPPSPPIDDTCKSVFYRCIEAYFNSCADLHDKDRVRYICPMADMGII